MVKILAEKGITSDNCEIFLLMLGISKAFFTENIRKTVAMVETIMMKCDPHMIHLLVNDVIFNVKIK